MKGIEERVRLMIKNFVVFSCFALVNLSANAQIVSVWALGDGEKVFRNDLNHPSKKSNHTWDGRAIRLEGLFNEVLAFQIIVETGSKGADKLDLVINHPLHKASGAIIGGNSQQYGPGGFVEVFSQHYLLVKDSTHPNWFYGSAAAKPPKMKGWIPDALIPADALPGKGGLPIDVAETRNQGFWIDLHLPRDQKKFPAGVYNGSVQVRQKGELVKEIPLEITLRSLYLPDQNQQTIWVFSSGLEEYYPAMSSEQLDRMIKFEGHRHRIDMTGGFEVNTSPFDARKMDSYKGYLDGSAFTVANGYQGPGQGHGEKLFPVGMYGSNVLGNTKDSVQQQSDLWVNWFRKNAPDTKYFWYMIDEPLADKYPWIKERSSWIRNNPGPGKELPTFTTTEYRDTLAEDIDLWAGFSGVELETLPLIRKNGGDHWFYNGNRPRYGSVILENTAVDMRVNSWILYKYDIPVHFIWHSTAWQHNGQGPKKHLHQNVFANPLTFINDLMEWGNGDGILFYPGHSPFYPEQERGINRLIPSIRLKNIRRGQQDAAILEMAETKAGKTKVMQILNRIVPKALSEVSMKDPVSWSQHGDDFDKARTELLRLLQ